LDALVTGMIWKIYGAHGAILFSLAGMGILFFSYMVYLIKKSKNV